MNLRSSHLANMGARLAGVYPVSRAAPVPIASASQEPDRATPDAVLGKASGESSLPPRAKERDGRLGVPGDPSCDRFELTLTPNVQATLLLAAKAAGVTPAEFVARAIVVYAQEVVGFPAMCDELFEAPEPARINNSRFRCAADHPGIPP